MKKKILIVTDLDEAFLKSLEESLCDILDESLLNTFNEIKDSLPIGISRFGELVIGRPYSREFYKHVLNNPDRYDLVVWTYGSRDFGAENYTLLFRDIGMPIYFLHLEDCQEAMNLYNGEGVKCLKPLQYIKDKMPEFKDHRIILFDDNETVLENNHIHEIYILPPWEVGKGGNVKDLGKSGKRILEECIEYIESLSNALNLESPPEVSFTPVIDYF